MRDDAQKALIDSYQKRMTRWGVTIQEYVAKNASALPSETLKQAEAELILKAIPDQAYVVAMDEKGKNLTSMQFSQFFADHEHDGAIKTIIFIIGGADGLHRDVKQRANMMISFGAQTWPHMILRIMLMEQCYRAQQILLNTAYHREG